MAVIKMIKKEAVINVPITTGLLQKLQQLIVFFVEDKTEEQLEQFKTIVQSSEKAFTEDWMQHLYIISSFVSVIENEAFKQGHTYDSEVSDDISTLES